MSNKINNQDFQTLLYMAAGHTGNAAVQTHAVEQLNSWINRLLWGEKTGAFISRTEILMLTLTLTLAAVHELLEIDDDEECTGLLRLPSVLHKPLPDRPPLDWARLDTDTAADKADDVSLVQARLNVLMYHIDAEVLVDAAGMTEDQYMDCVDGETEPSISQALALCAWLGVPVTWLVGGA